MVDNKHKDESSSKLFPQLNSLTDVEKQIKVARHLQCDQCDCIGWRSQTTAPLETEGDKKNDDNNKNTSQSTTTCYQCQHNLQNHLDKNHDFIRRLKVALRLDELLEEKGITLNGNNEEYLNDKDITSLRKQMDYNAEDDTKSSKDKNQYHDAIQHTSTEDDFLSEASSPSSIDAVVVEEEPQQQQHQQQQQSSNMKRPRDTSDEEDNLSNDKGFKDYDKNNLNKRFKVDTDTNPPTSETNAAPSKKHLAANQEEKTIEEVAAVVDETEKAAFADHEDVNDDEEEKNDQDRKKKEDEYTESAEQLPQDTTITNDAENSNRLTNVEEDEYVSRHGMKDGQAPKDDKSAEMIEVKSENTIDDGRKQQRDMNGSHSNRNGKYDNDENTSHTISETQGEDKQEVKVEEQEADFKIAKREPQLGDKRALNEEAIQVNDGIDGVLKSHENHSWDFITELSPAEKKETPAMIEERTGLIEVRVVENDGTRDNMILLTGLKNIFQKQLPKMPKEYIARLVYDRNHKSMALIRRPLKVIGGICFRPFEHQEFAEIVFCAIASTEQVKGYGSFLMSHLKDYVSGHSQIKHYLTYADNYATGYFRKQGFTTEITLNKRKWVGYIKDYEGGTIMQCTTVPKVKYLHVQDILTIQKKAVYEKMKQFSSSHIVYPGIQMPLNEEGKRCIDPYLVPGVKESGWTPEMDALSNRTKHPPHYNQMRHLVSELRANPHSWPFHEPVNAEEVTDYYEVILEPMDLTTLDQNVESDKYENLEDFINDVQKIFDNCRTYNAESTNYARCANRLERYFKERLRVWTNKDDD
ncbi:hypothetical protein BDF20DRAFT_115930 [Mycotypha africana]|uniref:uncharacterized protein n=1 Tax=Mycotypha africana TaxID=64632 RepID=UPI0023006BDF|nr:uncharacterized protein BDF20DRAFT_115930 [Mycotypha africana]KAI8970291.1 hypothetical protein BDF20DRAFT_115930 [Mycotypha africana]